MKHLLQMLLAECNESPVDGLDAYTSIFAESRAVTIWSEPEATGVELDVV